MKSLKLGNPKRKKRNQKSNKSDIMFERHRVVYDSEDLEGDGRVKKETRFGKMIRNGLE